MGSSYVDFRDHGFEANDATLEVWLALLVDEIDKLPEPPPWLQAVRDEWAIQATAHFGFGVMPGLDRDITDDQRRDAIVKLCRLALERLKSFGNPVPHATLNALRDWGEGYQYSGDPEASVFLRPAEYFIKLLEGTLTPDQSDARFPEHAS